MICDSKRVAYARFQPEDLLFNLCKGEKGLHNGRVQTIFLKVCYHSYFFVLTKKEKYNYNLFSDTTFNR